jgi:hypothetical protein
VLLFSVVKCHTEIIRIIFRLSYQPDSNFCYGRNNWGIHILVHVLCTHTHAHAHAHTQTRSLLLLRLYLTSVIVWSWGSSVSIVSDYRVDDPVFNPRQRQRISSSLCVQTSSEAHPASCTMGTGDPFPGVKCRRGVMLTTLPHPVPRSRINRSYTSSPPWRLPGGGGTAFALYEAHSSPLHRFQRWFTVLLTVSDRHWRQYFQITN